MIKNGFLQQSAFDEIDMFSVPEKQVMILLIIMAFYARTSAIIRSGATFVKIVSLPCREEIIRIKTTFENSDMAGIAAVETRMGAQLDELERMYRKVETA